MNEKRRAKSSSFFFSAGHELLIAIIFSRMPAKGEFMKKASRKSGQGLVEYALIVALLALVSVLALTNLGSSVNDGLLGNIQTNLDSAETKITTSP